MTLTIETLDVRMDDLEQLVERARQGAVSDSEYETLKAVVHTLGHVAELLATHGTTLGDLRRVLLAQQGTTEKTRTVLARAGIAGGAESASVDSSDPPTPRDRPRGHGRHGADAFTGARRVVITHRHLKAGDHCPGCLKGKIYGHQPPARLVRLIGQAPIAATVYELEKLRCNLCGEIFTAEAPPDVGPDKYDATAASMIAVLKYGAGVPFARLAGLQQRVEIPLPEATQWEIVHEVAMVMQPAFHELLRHAAQGEVLYNDDTSVPVLALRRERVDGRTGIFTSGIVSTRDGRQIALYFTGGKHAGENLATVLAHRAASLPPPIQMCDALARNLPTFSPAFETIVGYCLAHARRRFVNVTPAFPAQCRYVLETLGAVYHVDAQARAQGLSPEARLQWHQADSAPRLAELHVWLVTQLDEHRVEPNSGLGQAISYFLKHWDRLTLFLRVPGAPLDNNVCERALKKAILHRNYVYPLIMVTAAAGPAIRIAA
jgi:transposase